MVTLKHVGLYVSDLNLMAQFYKNVFGLYVLCEGEKDQGDFVDFLAGEKKCEIKVTKLITEMGKQNGAGDMIELIQINESTARHKELKKMTESGVMHIGFGVENIHTICDKIVNFGGKIIIPPFLRQNGNWLCFARDPEENWIEIIQNR